MDVAIGWAILLAWAASVVWVLYDAPRSGMSRAWALAVFVFAFFALPFYLIARASARRTVRDAAHLAVTQQATGGPQPAWLPDPWFPGRYRYWDGKRWTSDSSPRPK